MHLNVQSALESSNIVYALHLHASFGTKTCNTTYVTHYNVYLSANSNNLNHTSSTMAK
jgi:hypothetical protein